MSDTTIFRNELYYIVRLDNIPSIIQHGILCHDDAEKHDHVTIALEQVQERRENKSVPQGLPLHKYVNLYFNLEIRCCSWDEHSTMICVY